MDRFFIILVVFLLCVGVLLSGSKIGTLLNEELTDSVVNNNKTNNNNTDDASGGKTWYAANLPGGKQLCFLDFSEDAYFSPVDENSIYEGLDFGDAISDVNILGDSLIYTVSQFSSKLYYQGIVFDGAKLDVGSYDILVVDFELSTNNSYWPSLYLGLGTYDSEGYYCNLRGKMLNTEDGEYWIGDRGMSEHDDLDIARYYNSNNGLQISLDKLHITLISYDDTVCFYVNSVYVGSNSLNFDGVSSVIPYIYLDEFAVSGFSEGDNFAVENFEAVVFGNGDGTYDGIMSSVKEDFNFDFSQVLKKEGN